MTYLFNNSKIRSKINIVVLVSRMLKKSSLFLVWIFFLKGLCFGSPLLETEDLNLSLGTYFRTDAVSFKNVADLDSSNKDDHTAYLGIDYSLSFSADFKNQDPKFYLKLERNGPYDFSVPVFIHNTLINSGGRIGKYHDSQLLPQVEEFWADSALFDKFRIKAGLYIYEVGNGFSLNGSYENYGLTLYRETENIFWRVYYCRPDLVYKNHLGPRIDQEQEQEQKYEPNAANFFATDAKINLGNQVFWPYIGVLADYTSPKKRGDSLFSAPIKRDILGTFGTAWEFKGKDFSLQLEAAHNFGYAKSASSEYKDVQHTGYMFYSGLDYVMGKFNPSLQFLLCSGNKASLDMAGDPDVLYAAGKNRAFSYYSPSNGNLGDTISSNNVEMLPIVAMGGGYGLNYGVPRPKTFSSGDFENLIMPSIGFDFNATNKLSLGLYGYYLRSFTRPVGTLNGEGKYLCQELGYETDLFIDYQLNKNILVSLLGGYFFPGRYYKELRDDTTGSLFSPFVRGDGSPDCAYQLELSMELKF